MRRNGTHNQVPIEEDYQSTGGDLSKFQRYVIIPCFNADTGRLCHFCGWINDEMYWEMMHSGYYDDVEQAYGPVGLWPEEADLSEERLTKVRYWESLVCQVLSEWGVLEELSMDHAYEPPLYSRGHQFGFVCAPFPPVRRAPESGEVKARTSP